MKKHFLAPLFVASALLGGCGATDEPEDHIDHGNNQTTTTNNNNTESDQFVYYATPSPIEMASIITNSGAPYKPELMNAVQYQANYTTPISKALNIGVYGADMSYAAVFGHNDRSMEYLQALESMTADIGITGIFEANALKRLKDNQDNKDSLFKVITEYYWDADLYLQENDRPGTAALIATGAWIESLFLGTQCASDMEGEPLTAINARIIEQKLTLRNIIMMLKAMPQDEIDNSAILNELIPLQNMFEQIEMTIDQGQNVEEAQNRTTYLISQSKSSYKTVLIDDIKKKILEIRTKITSA